MFLFVFLLLFLLLLLTMDFFLFAYTCTSHFFFVSSSVCSCHFALFFIFYLCVLSVSPPLPVSLPPRLSSFLPSFRYIRFPSLYSCSFTLTLSSYARRRALEVSPPAISENVAFIDSKDEHRGVERDSSLLPPFSVIIHP